MIKFVINCDIVFIIVSRRFALNVLLFCLFYLFVSLDVVMIYSKSLAAN
jgi:hypothetical protein